MKIKKLFTMFVLALLSLLIVLLCSFSLILIHLFLKNTVLASEIDNEQETIQTINNTLDNELYLVDNPVIMEDHTFQLQIPQIELVHSIVANTDPVDENIYLKVLESQIAHGKGTYTPDITYKNNQGITYLFAHSQGQYAIFGRLNELEAGDKIFLNYAGYTYIYSVSDKVIVKPDQKQYYTSSSPKALLRIQTCEDGEKLRLIVDAKLIARI